jgi:hypothetical protein
MLYTVQLRLAEEDLADRMSEMRMWLDRQGYEPSLIGGCEVKLPLFNPAV